MAFPPVVFSKLLLKNWIMSNKPLVTIFQLSYNDEKYIAEALNGVLSQTYQPLQVIVSDDCSQDRTFAIVKDLVAKYDGPHQVIINQNEKNLGLGNNVNRIMQLAQGELIVESDGDDISFPNRVADTVKLWMDSGKKHRVMCGRSWLINEVGKSSGKLPKVQSMTFDKVIEPTGRQWVYGGSLAWHRSLFDIFGPLREGVVAQDKAIGFRSLLLGQEIGFVDRPIIKYRLHTLSLTHNRTPQDRLKHKVAMFGSYVQDLDLARSLGYFENRNDIDDIYQKFSACYADFLLRYEILSASLLRSALHLITCGNRLSIEQKKNLLLKRIKGEKTRAGW